MPRSISLPLLVTLFLSLTACAGKTLSPGEYSGFLQDYSQLTEKKLPDGQRVLSWVNPQITHYTRVYIEPSQFYLLLLPSERRSEAMLTEVSHYYDAALKQELGKVMTVVATPGPGTLIVRPAITSVSATTQGLRFYEWLPVTLLAAGVSTAIGIRDQDTQITTEVAVVDACNQAVVAQVIRKSVGLTLKNDKQAMTVDDFKPVLDDWALAMRQAYVSAGNQAHAHDFASSPVTPCVYR